jgi:hypothetical protein
MTITRLSLGVLAFTLVATTASAQGTYTDSVSGDARRQYSFTTVSGGQILATLSWDNQAANLFLILVCGPSSGSSEPLTFGAGAGGLDRTARLESGVFANSTCLVGVSTFDAPASFRLNLQSGSDQLATPRAAIAASPRRNPELETRLRAHAEAAFRALEQARR